MVAYCFKCKTKRDVENPQTFVMKNGHTATRGLCPTCGAKLYSLEKPHA